MKTIIFSLLFLTSFCAYGQSIFSKSFGNKKDEVLIFLHGGPGYNSVNFEVTTAQKLADNGYFVITYDRRGEGRSNDPNAIFNFQETFDDLNTIYTTYNITKATLIGHSFGGLIATLFAEANPTKVQKIILVGAPVSLQQTFKTIIEKSKQFYTNKKDSINLKYFSMLENMDTTSLEYSSYCFRHAMQTGAYSPKNPSEEANTIYASFKNDTLLKKYASKMTYQAPKGFWKNEKYTTINLKKNIENLKQLNIKVFGLYGKDDGLYSTQQIADLASQIGTLNMKYFDNCSHNVFIDQQTKFIEAIKIWVK